MPETRETAIVGGGCFWCLDAVFRELKGVLEVESGYAGGHQENPTYEQVCAKRTGHAEVVKVVFDPGVVSFSDLLRIFFTLHDPTTKDRQGADVGPQYRSIIIAQDEAQTAAAHDVIAEIDALKLWSGPIVTELTGNAPPLGTYWPGEAEHQDYFRINPWSGYCRAVVGPKVAKFRKSFMTRLKETA